jgi:hypothetical protein
MRAVRPAPGGTHVADIDWEPIITIVITILIEALFINWAARIVADRGGFGRSILVAIIGSIGAGLGWYFGGLYAVWLAWVLLILIWSAVAAAFFRTRLLKGAVIGLVAAVLFILVSLLVEWVIAQVD